MSNQYLKLRRSSIPSKIPDTGSLDFGELALNTYDGLIFMKKSGSLGEEIIRIGGTTSGSFTGSFLGSFTGSLQGTASYAINALTASYLSGYVSPFPYTGSAIITGSLVVTGSTSITGDITGSNALFTGTITAQKLVVQTITSSVLYSSGSNIFGNNISNTQVFTGSLYQTGSVAAFMGNVGIGTTSPAYKLDVNGNVGFSGDLRFASANTIYNASGDFYLRSAGILNLGSGASNSNMVISSTGNVGIGTTTPNSKLDINGNVNISGSGTTIPFQITSGSTSLMYVSSSGQMGIGTSTPAYRVQVAMPVGTDNFAITNGGSVLRFSTNIGSGNPGIASSGVIHFQSPINGTGGTEILQVRKAGGANFIQYWSSNTGTTLSAIDGNGNLGIGTGTIIPSASIHIKGATSSSLSSSVLVQNSNLSSSLVILDNGFVGIGKTPSYPLDIALTNGGNANSAMFVSNTAPDGRSILYGKANTNTEQLLYWWHTGGFGVGTGGSRNGGAVSFFNDASFYGPAHTMYFMESVGGGFGPNNVKYRLGVTTATTNTAFASGISNNLTNIESNTFTFTAKSHTFFTGTTTGNQALPNQFTPLFLSMSGSVGIRTITPLYTLDVSGSGRFTDGINVTGSLAFTGDITGSNALFTGTITAQKLVVQTVTSSIVYSSGSNIFGSQLTDIQSFTGSLQVTGSGNHWIMGGNVGIGTTSPADKLQVGVTNTHGTFTIGSTNGVDLTGGTGGWAMGYRFRGNAGTLAGGYWVNGTNDAVNYYTIGSAYNVGLTVLQSNGNVGIGTIAPSARLHISGAAATPLLRVSNPASADFTIQSDSTLTDYTGLYWGTDYKFVSKQSATLFVNTANNISFANGFAAKTTMNSNGQLGIGVSSAASILATAHVKGLGATSATTALLVQNSNASSSLVVLDNGNVGIGTTSPSASLHVAGTTILSSSFNTGISGSTLKVQGSGSALPIFTVVGSQGELFSINDSLSGSLFSVNDISGLPILEVFSDNTILLGNYQAPTLYTTNRILSTALGSNIVYSFPTSSYDGVFMDYTVKSGSNARAGNFAAIWSGTTVNYMDNSTTDFGSTAGMVLSGSISGSNMVIFASGSTAGWTFKGIIKSI